ncbi:MAG: hypothetical protein J5930_00005, partial [Treponema sp.]|nr:hypothetical protein [Treponema sp.]
QLFSFLSFCAIISIGFLPPVFWCVCNSIITDGWKPFLVGNYILLLAVGTKYDFIISHEDFNGNKSDHSYAGSVTTTTYGMAINCCLKKLTSYTKRLAGGLRIFERRFLRGST